VIELGPADAGSTRTVHCGEEIVVRLVEHRTTGYRWEIEPAEPVLRVTDDRYTAPGNGPGAAGERILRFTAATPGDIQLRLTSRRPWKPGGTPADAFAVTLHVTS
jgi:predicted secreted protein